MSEMARPLIYGKIADCMQQIGAIGKNSRNVQQNFMYRGVDAVMNALNPVLTANRMFCVPEVLEQHREERQTRSGGNLIYSILKMRYTLYAEDGSNVSAVVIGEGMDSADKGSNKAMSVAYKYAMFQIFSIPTEELVDPDGETPPESTRKTAQTQQEPDRAPTPPPAQAWNAFATVSKWCEEHKMTMKDFAACRKAAIAGGLVADIPSEQLTKAQCDTLLDAISRNFLPAQEQPA
jgi:hypothetical protein